MALGTGYHRVIHPTAGPLDPSSGVALVFTNKHTTALSMVTSLLFLRDPFPADVLLLLSQSFTINLPLLSYHTVTLITLWGLGYLTSPRSEAQIVEHTQI